MLTTVDPTQLCRRLRKSFRSVFIERYHPERHYMRGPGPACRRVAEMSAN